MNFDTERERQLHTRVQALEEALNSVLPYAITRGEDISQEYEDSLAANGPDHPLTAEAKGYADRVELVVGSACRLINFAG